MYLSLLIYALNTVRLGKERLTLATAFRIDFCEEIVEFCSKFQNSLVSQSISLSGKEPKRRILVHKLEQPSACCIAIFHKYCCHTKPGGITAYLTLRNNWEYITDLSKYHNLGTWNVVLKYITFYVQKHKAAMTMC